MTYYIDKYNGLWSYEGPGLRYPWLLLAGNEEHTRNHFWVTTRYSDQQVRDLAPLGAVDGTDQEDFVFAAEYKKGDQVVVDESALDSLGVTINHYVEHQVGYRATYVDKQQQDHMVLIEVVVEENEIEPYIPKKRSLIDD